MNYKKNIFALFIALVGVVITGCGNNNDSSAEYLNSANSEISIIAHRGYPTVKPENTLASFLAAKDIGADYIELDVQKSKDGEIVVFHDDTLTRVTGVEGAIGDYTLAELQSFDAGSFFSASCAGEQIPTLKDSLLLVKGELSGYESIRSSSEEELKVYLELKDIGDDEEFVSKVVSTVEECGMVERVVFASFNYDYISLIKKMNNAYQILYNTKDGSDALPSGYPADYYGIYLQSVSARTVEAIHDAGSSVFVWTVDSPEAMKNLIHMGVDGIVTNNAGLAKVATCEEYREFTDKSEKIITLPWLYNIDDVDKNYVVQGFTDVNGVLAVSAYDKTGENNSIIYLMNPDGTYLGKTDLGMKAHVGGIVYDESNQLLWCTAADGHVIAASWEEIRTGSYLGEPVTDFDAELVNHNDSKVASFLTMYDGDLFVGSYTIGQKGRLRKYDISDINSPVLVSEVDIPECIQGISFYKDALENKEYMLLSQSRETSDSHLLTFEYSENARGYSKPKKTMLIPEGAEGIQVTVDGIYILFESGSKPYRETARIPNDKLYLIRK